MSLANGTRLGPYAVTEPIGAGGMGEVYRATDTRLDRTVAIKVLPEHLADDPQRRERFEREARAVSSLNHPHICTLHDVGEQDGVHYLVMELVEGDTLGERLEKGRLPLDQALEYAIQIADALDKAHRQGVVHRDLKPGNIMITKSAGVKLLDFGLAKLKGDDGAVSPLSQMPTQDPSAPLTAEGTIIGTLQYMAPEQLEGKEADARTDIFAFGAVVYEMITGKRAFEGKSQVSLMAAILEHDPTPMQTLQQVTPAMLERLVLRCLAKDPEDRWQTARDIVVEIRSFDDAGIDRPAEPTAGANRERLWIAATVLALLTASVLAGIIYFGPAPEAPAPVRFVFETTPDAQAPLNLRVSPDGRYVVNGGVSADGINMLWLRSVDSLEYQPIRGTEGANSFTWSPDSESLVFFDQSELKLKIVERTGSAPIPVCDISEVTSGGLTWNENDTILFSAERRVLHRVPASGGTPTPITALDDSLQETRHSGPRFLPDGQHYLFLVTSADPENSGIYLGSLGSPDRERLVATTQRFDYGSGHLLFFREEALMAQPFDPDRLEMTGNAFLVSDEVAINSGNGNAGFSVSDNGVLAYRPVSDAGMNTMVWIDREGRIEEFVSQRGEYVAAAEISPDGARVAVSLRDNDTRNIWVYDTDTGTPSRLTDDDLRVAGELVWTNDSRNITFRVGANIYQQPWDGSESSELLWEGEGLVEPIAWSRDGNSLLIEVGRVADLTMLSMADKDASSFGVAGVIEAALSPDGRWIAYMRVDSPDSEVWVAPYPGPGSAYQVAEGNVPTFGDQREQKVMWSPNGRGLLYTDGSAVLSAPLRFEPSFSSGEPTRLFDLGTSYELLDLHPDGTSVLARSIEGSETQQIVVVTNWLEQSRSPQ